MCRDLALFANEFQQFRDRYYCASYYNGGFNAATITGIISGCAVNIRNNEAYTNAVKDYYSVRIIT